MAKPAFINLWNNYPEEDSPCDGSWTNQCAIRMSITLNAELTIRVDAHTARPDQLSAQLAGFQLRLEENGASCLLKSVDRRGIERSHQLDLPLPCAFHHDRGGALRIVRSGKFQYAIVESARAGSGSDCETRLRSIRATGQHLQVSQHLDRVASCPPFQWDRYMFTGLFD